MVIRLSTYSYGLVFQCVPSLWRNPQPERLRSGFPLKSFSVYFAKKIEIDEKI